MDVGISDLSSRDTEVREEVIQAPQGKLSMRGLSPGATSSTVERIIGPTGEITLQFSGAPSIEAYQFLEDYIKLRKGVLTQKSGSEEGRDEE